MSNKFFKHETAIIGKNTNIGNGTKIWHWVHEMCIRDRGIRGTYYFRIIPESFDEEVIKEISSMNHEIGYHYEDMDLANGNHNKAIKLFEQNLNKLKDITDISTICMHGSPLSKYDNRSIWDKHNYKDYGIKAEPYFDLDFSKVLYITDTGRRWNGDNVSVRDRSADDTINPQMKNKKPLSEQYFFTSTLDIINASKNGLLPDQIMFNFHPQRWTNNSLSWVKELVWQNTKNILKLGLKKLDDKR